MMKGIKVLSLLLAMCAVFLSLISCNSGFSKNRIADVKVGDEYYHSFYVYKISFSNGITEYQITCSKLEEKTTVVYKKADSKEEYLKGETGGSPWYDFSSYYDGWISLTEEQYEELNAEEKAQWIRLTRKVREVEYYPCKVSFEGERATVSYYYLFERRYHEEQYKDMKVSKNSFNVDSSLVFVYFESEEVK